MSRVAMLPATLGEMILAPTSTGRDKAASWYGRSWLTGWVSRDALLHPDDVYYQ